ncbi:MAG: FkbM family methyltransferase [Gammaproteobacteria bacterium]|nr:FkbM family methyltransferase [Gammaproteobacteria bacterium]MDH5801230.1 FkbM family methyltransferase [Gammaproteobacteria bacterium]
MSFLSKIEKVVKNIANPDYWLANKRGVFAAIEHVSVLNNMNCNTVIDVGANKGQFALVARSRFPEARIYSFEPLEDARKILQSLFDSDKNFDVSEFALGEDEGKSIFHVSKRRDSSSLLGISEKQSEYFPGTEEIGQIYIEVKQMDSIISNLEIIPPVLLKIDVQGGELGVLRGGSDFLHTVSHVYVEASFVELYSGQALVHQVIEYLSQYDFILTGVYNGSFDSNGLAIQADFLFQKKSI